MEEHFKIEEVIKYKYVDWNHQQSGVRQKEYR